MDIRSANTTDQYAWDVTTDSGSHFTVAKVADGTLRVQTSGDQRFVLAHVPYYVDATLFVRESDATDVKIEVEVKIGQVAFKFTGRNQSQPDQTHIEAVTSALQDAIIDLTGTRSHRRSIGVLPSGDDAFRRATLEWAAKAQTTAQNKAARAHGQRDQLVERLAAATEAASAAQRVADEARSLLNHLAEFVPEVTDLHKCRLIHGNVGPGACSQEHPLSDYLSALPDHAERLLAV